MNKKHAFIVYAGEQEQGRVFHALTHALQAHERGDTSELYFAAEGTAWPGLLANAEHRLHGLFNTLQNKGVIQGACHSCVITFGHEQTTGNTVPMITGPECSYGQIDILGLEDDGYRVWLF